MRHDQFVIIGAGHSGLSDLRQRLASSSGILCHGHVFSDREETGLEGIYQKDASHSNAHQHLEIAREQHPVDFLLRYVFDPQGKESVGFLFDYTALLAPTFAEQRDIIRRNKDIKIIHAIRGNLFERLVDELRAKTGCATVDQVSISISECEADFALIQARVLFVRKMMRDHPTLELVYEEYDDARLFAFLGADQDAHSIAFVTQQDSNYASRVSNYAELKTHFAGTAYAPFFEVAS